MESAKFFTDAAKKEHAELKRKQVTVRHQSPALQIRSVTPTGSEFDDEDMVSEEDSDDSWTTQEEFPKDFILRYSNISVVASKEGDGDKPFACPVPGCKKRYKNVNGIKYHARNGHRKESKVKKAYKCVCGKSYKTPQGLRNHSVSHHPATELLSLHPQQQTVALTKSMVLASLGTKPISPSPTTGALASAIVQQVTLTGLAQPLTPPVTPNSPVVPTSIPPTSATKIPTTKPSHNVTAASHLTQLAESSAKQVKGQLAIPVLMESS